MAVSKDELKRQLSDKYGDWATPILESQSFQNTLDAKIERQSANVSKPDVSVSDPYGNEPPIDYPDPKTYSKPLPEYQGAYANGRPTNVSEPMQQFSQVNVATQEYADDIQKRIIDDWYGYQNDDNYQGMLSKTYTEQTYNYLKRKNNNANDTAWSKPNPEDELFTRMPTWVKSFDETRKTEAELAKETPTEWYDVAEQSAYKGLTTQAQREIMDAKDLEHGNWFLMSNWEKAKYLLIPSSSKPKLDEAPELVTKITQSVMPTVMSAGAGSMVGGIVGGILGSIVAPGAGTAGGAALGSKVGAVIFGGAAAIQGMTNTEVPVISDILTGLNYVGDKTEQFLGSRSAAYHEAKRILGENATLIELCQTAGEILAEPENEYLWEVSKYAYEVGAGTPIDELTNTIYNTAVDASNNIFGTNYEHRNITDVNRGNLARTGWEETLEDTHGAESLIKTYTPIFTGLVDAAMAQGMTKEDAIEFAHMNMQEYILNYQGNTGLLNDLVAQSYQDPTNFVNFAMGKMTQGIGNLTGDKALADAGKAAVGNPLIDALDPVSQPIVEALLSPLDRNKKNTPDLLKVHGSQGLDVIRQTYSNNVRALPDVDKLSYIQKSIAGLDSEGRIKDLMPVKHTGNKVLDWFIDFFSKTEETRMFDMSQEVTTKLGSLLFDDGVPLDELPQLVAEITGKVEIADNSLLKGQENSAIMRTLREGLESVPDDVMNKIMDDVDNYRKFATNREILDVVANDLRMKPRDVLDALDNKKDGAKIQLVKKDGADVEVIRQDLIDKIRQKGVTYTDPSTGKVFDTEAVIANIDRFKDNRQQYSPMYMKANVLSELSKAVDDYNLKRYNIQPDAWWSRMSDLTKSMQSIALLNFSPSYIVNNFLNNMLTRTVSGVGGVETDYVKNLNAERGLFFSRSDEAIQAEGFHKTGETIKGRKRANDKLQSFNDLFKKVTDNKVFKGLNNIDIEGRETRAASDLGMKRYWDATWETNIPAFPKEWDLLGFDDATKSRIRDIAIDSSNYGEFIKRVSGEINYPSAQSVINHALESYDPKTRSVMKDFISKNSWIEEGLNNALQTNDVNIIGKAIEGLKDDLTIDIGFENVVEQASQFHDYLTTISSQGITGIAEGRQNIDNLYNKLWADQTKQNVSLFLDRLVKFKGDEDAFEPYYMAKLSKQQAEYNIVRDLDVMLTAAMCESLGLSDDLYVRALENTIKKYDIMQEQALQNHEIHKKYGRTDSPDYDIEYYKKTRVDMLQKAQDIQVQCDVELNQIMVDYLRNNLEGSKDAIDLYEQTLNEIIEMKKTLNAHEIEDLVESMDTKGKFQRWKIRRSQEITRLNEKKAIGIRQSYANDMFKSLDNAVRTEPSVTQPISLDTTLKAMLFIDEAHRKAEQKGDFLKHYVDKTDPMTTFTPIDYRNQRVNTSFWEYAEKNNNIEYRASIQDLYDKGEAVPLGEANTTPLTYTETSDTYKLVNPDTDVSSKVGEFVQAKCYPVQTADGIAEAGVYHNGEHIGYVVDGMVTKIHVGDNDYPVICMSKDQPNTYLVLVQDKIWEVTAGKLNNADYTPFALENFHPATDGDTPTIEKWGSAYLESSQPIREFFDILETQAKKSITDARNNGSLLDGLTPEQQEAILGYAKNDMRQAYSLQRYQTQKYGDAMVDLALLNYNDRYGFDNLLTAIMPYQFWMTRSVANWGKRMISQPKWYAAYARLEKLMEKNKRDVNPTRLDGTTGLLMPNLGDGMGSTLYIDPWGIIFPFKQFRETPQYYNRNYNTVVNNTKRIIEEYYLDKKPYDGEIITDAMYKEAMKGTGELYHKVFAEQQRLDESDTGMTGLVSTFLSPNVLIDALVKKAQGHEGSISNSPMYRLGTTVKAMGDKTGAQWLTDLVGNALQVPDKAFRKAIGVEANPEGNFFDYYISTYVTNMWVEGDISEDEMKNALINRRGEAYDEAVARYHQQQALRQQGGALGVEIAQSLAENKKTSVLDIANAALASAFGGKVFPLGEEIYREQRQVKQLVNEADNKELTSQFYDDFPEYTVHNWSYEDDFDTKVHKILVSTVWDTYNALPSSQKTAVAKGIERFNYFFLDPDTRAQDCVPDDELKTWIRAMRGEDIEFTQAEIDKPMQDAINIKWYADSVQSGWDRLQRDIRIKYPNYDAENEAYNNLPNKDLQDKYLLAHPDLQLAWDYKKAAIRANPALAVYDNDRTATYNVGEGEKYQTITDAVQAKLTDWVKGQLENYMNPKLRWKMKPDAEHALKTVYASLGTNVPYEEWLENVSK